MAAPVMYYQNIFHRENHTFCWEWWPHQNQKKVYVVCTFIFGYVLPLLLITFCYAKVSKAIRVGHLISEKWLNYPKTYVSSISLLAGFKPLAQKTKKYVQKVRGIKEKGMYYCLFLF